MAQKKTVSADSANPIETIANLWPYMWPADRIDLKLRVVWATVILVIAKAVLVLVPYFFKWRRMRSTTSPTRSVSCRSS